MSEKRLILFQGLPGSGLTTSVKRYSESLDSKIYKRVIVGNLLEPYDKPRRVNHATYNSYYMKLIMGKTKWHVVKAMCDEVPIIIVDFYNHDPEYVANLVDHARIDRYNVVFKQPESPVWSRMAKPVLANKMSALISGDFDTYAKELYRKQVSTHFNQVFIKRMMNKIVLR